MDLIENFALPLPHLTYLLDMETTSNLGSFCFKIKHFWDFFFFFYIFQCLVHLKFASEQKDIFLVDKKLHQNDGKWLIWTQPLTPPLSSFPFPFPMPSPSSSPSPTPPQPPPSCPVLYNATSTSHLSAPLVLPPPPKNFNLLFHEKSLTQGFGIFTHNNTNFSSLESNPKILKYSHRAHFCTKNHYFHHHQHLPSLLPFALTFPSTPSL